MPSRPGTTTSMSRLSPVLDPDCEADRDPLRRYSEYLQTVVLSHMCKILADAIADCRDHTVSPFRCDAPSPRAGTVEQYSPLT